MSQIDEMIDKAIDEFCKLDGFSIEFYDSVQILRRFAAEVCKAMLQDCLKDYTGQTVQETIDVIKERAEKWIGVPPKVGTS